MKSILTGLTVAFLTASLAAQQQQPPAPQQQPQAQQKAGQATQVRGKIVSRSQDNVIVQTNDNRKVTLYINPQTRYSMNNRAVQFTDLRDGAFITADYAVDGNRWIASNFLVGEAEQAPNTALAPTDQAAANETVLLDATVQRVTPPDQIVVRSSESKDVIIHVTKQTSVQVNSATVSLDNIKQGARFDVYYTVQNGQNVATRMIGVTLLEGEVSRVEGKDQVIVRGANGQEVPVYVMPQTTYRFGTQSGAFTDLRPGMPIRVYYDSQNSRNRAYRIWRR